MPRGGIRELVEALEPGRGPPGEPQNRCGLSAHYLIHRGKSFRRVWSGGGGLSLPGAPAFLASSMTRLVSSDGSLDGSTASERKGGEEQGHVLQHIDLTDSQSPRRLR